MRACQVHLAIVCIAAFVGAGQGSLRDTYIDASVYFLVSPHPLVCPPLMPPQVEFSKQLNESRIRVLQAREDALQELLAESYSQVRRPPHAHKLAAFEEVTWREEEVPWREEEVPWGEQEVPWREQMCSSPMAWHL